MSTETLSPTRVREIPAGASTRAFVDLAWTVNAGDPNWVPPLRMTVETAMDRGKHPFHRHAEVAYFLAERGGRAVGRVAAVVNRRHNEYHGDRTGFYGLFECEEDEGTARLLLDAAADWLRARGMERMRGPLNLSTNEEASSPGVLVEGFDTRPMVMMTHNPPYYERLHEAAGMEKAKDLVALWLDDSMEKPARAARVAQRILEGERATIRAFDGKHFRRDVEILKGIYNAAWSRNWGFVPMTDEEFEHMAKEFRPVADLDLCLIAEVDGEPVGFSLALPDLNQALRHLPDGRLLPLGFLKLLWHRRKVRGLRVITLGFKPGYQHSGIGAAFYIRTWEEGVRKGYTHAEASWILEDNLEMLRPVERMGGRRYRRYRVYERGL